MDTLRGRAVEFFFVVALAAVLVALSVHPGLAQFVPAPAPSTPSLPTNTAEVDSYVAHLDDGAARALLIDQLRIGVEESASTKNTSTLGAVALGIRTVRDVGGMALERLQSIRDAIGEFDA